MSLIVLAENSHDDRETTECCTQLTLTASEEDQRRLLASLVEWALCGGKLVIESNSGVTTTCVPGERSKIVEVRK